MLSIQIGNSSDYVMTMPKQESELLPQTAYTQGRCFPWMGEKTRALNFAKS